MGSIFGEYGLVLSGGGGKAAFEAGALSEIKKIMSESKCIGISGTSVGALNAALFAAGSDPAAIWRKLSSDDVIDRSGFEDYTKLTELLYGHINLIRDISSNVNSVIKKLNYTENEAVYAFSDEIRGRKTHSLFKKDALLNIIKDENLDDKLSACEYPVFACVARIKNMFISKKYYDITNEKNRQNSLLSTTSLPVIFNINETMDSSLSYYCDGGLFDSLPIAPLYDGIGCENLIVVHLNFHHKHRKHNYRNARMIHIFPGEYLGNMQTGSLNFDSERIEKLINDGIDETQKQLSASLSRIENTDEDLRGKHIYNGMIFDSLDDMYLYIDNNVNNNLQQKRLHEKVNSL